jgi:hypothetical protein
VHRQYRAQRLPARISEYLADRVDRQVNCPQRSLIAAVPRGLVDGRRPEQANLVIVPQGVDRQAGEHGEGADAERVKRPGRRPSQVTFQELHDGRDEPVGVIKPGIMPSARLDDESGRGEQRGELGGYRRWPLQVQASGEDKHRRIERGKRRAGCRGIERSLGGEGSSRVLVGLLASRGLVSRGGGVPAGRRRTGP